MTAPVRYKAPGITTVEPVKFMDLTGLQEDILWAIGRASRLGQLARVESHTDHRDGTVTARVGYIGTPLVLPTREAPALPTAPVPAPLYDERIRRDSMDYLMVGVKVAGVAVAGTALWLAYVLVSAVLAWLAANIAMIATGAVVIVGLLVLLMLSGGGGCAGIHCGGCRG